MVGLFQQLMADAQTTASSFASADQKIADYLENRKISPAIRAQSTLSALVLAKGVHSERPWCADQPLLLIVGMTEK